MFPEGLTAHDIQRLSKMKERTFNPFTGDLIGGDRITLANAGRSAADTIAVPSTNQVRQVYRRVKDFIRDHLI